MEAMDRTETDLFTAERTRLVEEIIEEVRRTAKHTGRGELDPRVIAALARVPRHEFVPPDMIMSAYVNRPLGIGHGQTISQPFIVALMSDLLELRGDERVLEIGTGSGYQAAMLAELAREVFTVEVVPSLAASARATLDAIGYTNIRYRVGNGRDGWPEEAPFSAIMVTAAADTIPDTLVEQLAPFGRMMIPVGKTNGPQNLVLVTKDAAGRTSKDTILAVAFVPLVGKRN
jgi:protein-L-isoaspartate(D-aspartate) O-methyltransferase